VPVFCVCEYLAVSVSAALHVGPENVLHLSGMLV
jgi:hypothetical protein